MNRNLYTHYKQNRNIDLHYEEWDFFSVCLFGVFYLLHIDLWQGRQSRISGTGCSSCVNRMIPRKQEMCVYKQITWIMNQKNEKVLWNYIYTGYHNQSDSQSRPISWSHNQVRTDVKLGATCGRRQWASGWETEMLSGALNIESTWLRRYGSI